MDFRNFPKIFEELLHTLMGFSKFSENFRRITTHTYGIFENFPEILAIDCVGYFTGFFFVRTKKNASYEPLFRSYKKIPVQTNPQGQPWI